MNLKFRKPICQFLLQHIQNKACSSQPSRVKRDKSHFTRIFSQLYSCSYTTVPIHRFRTQKPKPTQSDVFPQFWCTEPLIQSNIHHIFSLLSHSITFPNITLCHNLCDLSLDFFLTIFDQFCFSVHTSHYYLLWSPFLRLI
jgi:hypothetical protein